MPNNGNSANAVKVITTARLHLGFFDLNAELGRKFGSMGVSLDEPLTEVIVRPSPYVRATGNEASRAESVIFKLRHALNLPATQGADIEILQAIPSHSGLGSGTQLALAVGAAYARLYDLDLDATQIASLTSRGARSGIGIGTFLQGGLVVDGGRGTNTAVPPVLARIQFPVQWRILMMMDADNQGIYGEQEVNAFNQLQPVPSAVADKLCRQVLMQALPGLMETDLPRFGEAVRALQNATGDYFAPIQGGRYASKKIAAVLEYLETQKVSCFGQSSWGPTGFAVFESETKADELLTQLKEKFADIGLSWKICRACNHGAQTITLDE